MPARNSCAFAAAQRIGESDLLVGRHRHDFLVALVGREIDESLNLQIGVETIFAAAGFGIVRGSRLRVRGSHGHFVRGRHGVASLSLPFAALMAFIELLSAGVASGLAAAAAASSSAVFAVSLAASPAKQERRRRAACSPRRSDSAGSPFFLSSSAAFPQGARSAPEYTARFAGSEGMGLLPSMTCLIIWLSGNSSAISFELMCNVRKGARRASMALSGIFSGCSCRSIQRSTPIAMTCWTSPGRGPKVRRLSACTARFCSFGPASRPCPFSWRAVAGPRRPGSDTTETAQASQSGAPKTGSHARLPQEQVQTVSDYEPYGEKVASHDVIPGGLESDCRTRASETHRLREQR